MRGAKMLSALERSEDGAAAHVRARDGCGLVDEQSGLRILRPHPKRERGERDRNREVRISVESCDSVDAVEYDVSAATRAIDRKREPVRRRGRDDGRRRDGDACD